MIRRVFFAFTLILMVLSVASLYLSPTDTASPKQRHTPPNTPTISTRDKSRITDTTPLSFYQTIIDNNIFRPLGWRKPIRQPQYQLIGTSITSDGSEAIIQDKHSNHLYTLSIGDTIGEATLQQIHPKRVILKENDKHTTLRLTQSFLR